MSEFFPEVIFRRQIACETRRMARCGEIGDTHRFALNAVCLHLDCRDTSGGDATGWRLEARRLQIAWRRVRPATPALKLLRLSRGSSSCAHAFMLTRPSYRRAGAR